MGVVKRRPPNNLVAHDIQKGFFYPKQIDCGGSVTLLK